MARKIFMNVAEGDECRIAVLENGKLFEYFVDRPGQLKHVGNIYKGLINNVEPGIQAAFVDVGLERNGFLHISDVNYAYENNPDVKDLFSRTLRVKEPLPEDAILATQRERDVETVAEFVAPEPASGRGPEEAAFLDKLDAEQTGHRISSPVRGETEPASADSGRLPAVSADSGRFSAVRPDELKTETPPAPSATPAFPTGQGAPAPEGERKRRRRRRGRRGRRNGEGQRPAAPTPDQPAAIAQPAAPQVSQQPEPQPAAQAPVAEAKRGGTEPPATEAVQEAPAASKDPATPRTRQRRRRTPKKRGGHLPKRVLEGESDAQGNRDIDGKSPEGAGPAPGPQYRYNRGGPPKIQGVLKRNQEVVVQVTKASQGGKGPGLSTFISLPGRYMVLTPSSNRGGVSRKIEDGGARNELRKMLDKLPVPEGMGVIIRTAAIDRSYDELARDLNYLLRVWSVIVQRIHEAEAPALLYSDSDPAIRAVRDYFTAETEEIVIDSREVYDRVVDFFEQLMPSFKDRVKLYEGDVPLFFANGLENQIEHIFDKKVPLKSGGYLFIEQTEALVSIDVNSGKFTSAGDAEKTAYLTNVEAIPEICRQLRLRDLGGIVCCDLIDMLSAKHRNDVENALKRELRKDRARTKVARFSPFGVIEMTRQRVRPSIKSYTFVSCPTCGGFGMVRSAETSCLSLLRRMKLALGEERVKELVVQVHPHVLTHLHNEFREDIDELEESFDKAIIFEYAKDLTLGQSRFFYVNDRAARVLYDMDQRINTFVKGESWKSQTNVALPVAATGSASPQAAQAIADADSRRRRKRRGGRKQREREQERLAREQRIKDQAGKAVSFGDKLPDAPVIEVIRETAHAPAAGEHRGRGRRRGRGKRQETGEKTAAPAINTGPKVGTPEPAPAQAVQAGGESAAKTEFQPQGVEDMAKKKGKKPAKKAAKKPAKKAAKKPAKKPAKKAAKKAPAKRKAPARKPAAKRAPAKAPEEE